MDEQEKKQFIDENIEQDKQENQVRKTGIIGKVTGMFQKRPAPMTPEEPPKEQTIDEKLEKISENIFALQSSFNYVEEQVSQLGQVVVKNESKKSIEKEHDFEWVIVLENIVVESEKVPEVLNILAKYNIKIKEIKRSQ